jgi:hypothetical protein
MLACVCCCRPTLLVGLFAPPEEISAASMLETLYFYGEVFRL